MKYKKLQKFYIRSMFKSNEVNDINIVKSLFKKNLIYNQNYQIKKLQKKNLVLGGNNNEDMETI